MKKLFVMFAAILFCGAMMVSCTKEENKIENNTTASTDVNPDDMIGNWEGTYNGSTTYQGNQLTYSIKWTANITTVKAGTMTATITTNLYQDITFNYIITGVSPRQNTDYVTLTVRQDGALFDDTFEMLYNKSSKTLKGNMTLMYQADLTIGGETTLSKK